MGTKSQKDKKYIPHKAAAEFKPSFDWSIEEAKNSFANAKHPIDTNKIYYEECVQGMNNLPEESIDTIIADPPFGLDFSGKESIYNREKNNVIDGYQEVKIEDYADFTDKWIAEIPRILKKEGTIWIISGWTNLKDILISLDKHNLTTINHIIWKYQFGVFTKNKFVTSHYHILFAVKDKKKYFFNKFEHYPEDVWILNREYMPGMKKNATKLPIELVKRCIDFGSKPGDLVLDPFMGNGTTATAAKSSYRHYLGFELNKSLEEIINWNLNQIKTGELYKPYSECSDEIVINAKKKFAKKEKSKQIADYIK